MKFLKIAVAILVLIGSEPISRWSSSAVNTRSALRKNLRPTTSPLLHTINEDSMEGEEIQDFGTINPSILGINPKASEFVPKRQSTKGGGNGQQKTTKSNRSRSQTTRKRRRKKDGDQAKRKHIKLYSQNVHGIYESRKDENNNPIKNERSYVKLEFIVNKMMKDEIDIYLLQETWDEGDDAKDVGNGYYMFKHNVDVKDSSKTGVAIILSPRIVNAWKDAGGRDPVTTTKGGQFEGRFIGVTLKMQNRHLPTARNMG